MSNKKSILGTKKIHTRDNTIVEGILLDVIETEGSLFYTVILQLPDGNQTTRDIWHEWEWPFNPEAGQTIRIGKNEDGRTVLGLVQS